MLQNPWSFCPYATKMLWIILGLCLAAAVDANFHGNAEIAEPLSQPELLKMMKEMAATIDDLKVELQKKSLDENRLNDVVLDIAKLKEGNQQKKSLDESQVPMGFVYIQLPNQYSPDLIWPEVTWLEVTTEYAGLFFRAEGGESLPFGSTQNDQTRRISQMGYTGSTEGFPHVQNITASGWSEYGLAGGHSKTDSLYLDGLRFYVANEEVRPRNTAIRIWKRTM